MPVTKMCELVVRLSTKEVLGRMEADPVFAAKVFDLVHRAALRRRVKCHNCHMQKRATTMLHDLAVEKYNVLEYWEECMDPTTGVMSDGPLHGAKTAMQAKMWVDSVYQFDKCMCRGKYARRPELVCCRCQVEDAKAAAAAAAAAGADAAAAAAAPVRLCKWCAKGNHTNCNLGDRKERRTVI